MTVQHHKFDSGIINDTPEEILAEIEKYCAQIAHHDNCEIFVRMPLRVDRETEFGGRKVARVYARWTFLASHKPKINDSSLLGLGQPG